MKFLFELQADFAHISINLLLLPNCCITQLKNAPTKSRKTDVKKRFELCIWAEQNAKQTLKTGERVEKAWIATGKPYFCCWDAPIAAPCTVKVLVLITH